jgi:hypothetical protein
VAPRVPKRGTIKDRLVNLRSQLLFTFFIRGDRASLGPTAGQDDVRTCWRRKESLPVAGIETRSFSSYPTLIREFFRLFYRTVGFLRRKPSMVT